MYLIFFIPAQTSIINRVSRPQRNNATVKCEEEMNEQS